MVTSTLDQFADMADAGLVSEDEARRLARKWLASLTPVNGDYVFVFGPDNRALVYPEPALLNSDLSRFTDFKGRSVVEAAREEALRYGDTFLTYDWKAVGLGVLKPKYGHFVPYRRWDWIVASVGDVGAVQARVDIQMAHLVSELRETLPQVVTAGGGSVFILDGDGDFVVPPNTDLAKQAVASVDSQLTAIARDGASAGEDDAVFPIELADGDTLETRTRYIKALD